MGTVMTYETVIDQIKLLPESSLKDLSRYIVFLKFKLEKDRKAQLIEIKE